LLKLDYIEHNNPNASPHVLLNIIPFLRYM
jgi:hypothetical protein